MEKSVNEADKAEAYRERTSYWENMANKIDLSMPESLEFFAIQLEEAKEYHQFFKRQPSGATSRNVIILCEQKSKGLKIEA